MANGAIVSLLTGNITGPGNCVVSHKTGTLAVIEYVSGIIRVLYANGTLMSYPTTAFGFTNSATGITMDASDNIYACAYGGSYWVKLTPSGTFTAYSVTGLLTPWK